MRHLCDRICLRIELPHALRNKIVSPTTNNSHLEGTSIFAGLLTVGVIPNAASVRSRRSCMTSCITVHLEFLGAVAFLSSECHSLHYHPAVLSIIHTASQKLELTSHLHIFCLYIFVKAYITFTMGWFFSSSPSTATPQSQPTPGKSMSRVHHTRLSPCSSHERHH